jgi:hypothetical protein
MPRVCSKQPPARSQRSGETPGSMASGRRLGLEIQVPQPAITPTVTAQQLQRWANGSAVNPDERIRKDRLRAILTGTGEYSEMATKWRRAKGRRHRKPAQHTGKDGHRSPLFAGLIRLTSQVRHRQRRPCAEHAIWALRPSAAASAVRPDRRDPERGARRTRVQGLGPRSTGSCRCSAEGTALT